jgi:hypothetical protein
LNTLALNKPFNNLLSTFFTIAKQDELFLINNEHYYFVACNTILIPYWLKNGEIQYKINVNIGIKYPFFKQFI